jgi:hypothetical protein
MKMTIDEYLANGGTITRCPTVYLLPVTGAAPLVAPPGQGAEIVSTFGGFTLTKNHVKRGQRRGSQALSELARKANAVFAAEFEAAEDRMAFIAAAMTRTGKSRDSVLARLKRAGVSVAGLGSRPGKHVITEEMRAEIERLRASGMTVDAISATVGIGKSSVSKYLRASGDRRGVIDANRAEAVRAVARAWLGLPQPVPLPGFAEQHGISYHTLRSAIRRLEGQG